MTDGWKEAIAEEKDHRQSAVLAGVLGTVLLTLCVRALLGPDNVVVKVRMLVLSLTFAAMVWLVRAATPAAAGCGAMVCLLLGLAAGEVRGLAALTALFGLTFAATRAGRVRKAAAGLAEARQGRKAAQVLANLGAAGLFAGEPMLFLAALAEATADTVASEIGQAFGGTPRLLTGRRVAAGTDGAVSVVGSLAGVAGAALVMLTGWGTLGISGRQAGVALAGGLVGFVGDTVLGATGERRGWIGNDGVNFVSTLVAVLAAWCLERFL